MSAEKQTARVKRENTRDQVARLPGGRWAPGHSPNPGGRPRVIGEIRDLAREHTDIAVRALVEIAANGRSESARVAAANSLLDRGWGRPLAPLEVQPPGRDIVALIEDAHRRALDVIATTPLVIEAAIPDIGATNGVELLPS